MPIFSSWPSGEDIAERLMTQEAQGTAKAFSSINSGSSGSAVLISWIVHSGHDLDTVYV